MPDRLAALQHRIWIIMNDTLTAVQPARLFRALGGEAGQVPLPGGGVWPPVPVASLPVLAIGKAACAMTAAAIRHFHPLPLHGLTVTKTGHGQPLPGFQLREASHPVPDQTSLAAAQICLDWIANDLPPHGPLLVLLSGGASALFCAPAAGLSLADKMETNRLLLASGAGIQEINTVRKHLSAVKGGQLAVRLQDHAVLTLAISDVPGDAPDIIGSGPTVPDPSTFAGALDVLNRYHLFGRIPPAARQRLESGLRGEVEETPKPGTPLFCNKPFRILGGLQDALQAARRTATRLGCRVIQLESRDHDGVESCVMHHLQALNDRLHQAIPAEAEDMSAGKSGPSAVCLISGGEAAVRVTGPGTGGRNQEFILRLALALDGRPENILAISFGTDGTDGPTPAAGASCTPATCSRARAMGLDPLDFLARQDSFHFFQALGDSIITGPTGTNVMDVRIILAAV